jgi:hypothetical protein
VGDGIPRVEEVQFKADYQVGALFLMRAENFDPVATMISQLLSLALPRFSIQGALESGGVIFSIRFGEARGHGAEPLTSAAPWFCCGKNLAA